MNICTEPSVRRLHTTEPCSLEEPDRKTEEESRRARDRRRREKKRKKGCMKCKRGLHLHVKCDCVPLHMKASGDGNSSRMFSRDEMKDARSNEHRLTFHTKSDQLGQISQHHRGLLLLLLDGRGL